jgi:hypothetical protein
MCINIKIHSKQIWPQELPVNTGGLNVWRKISGNNA